ncbi:MAG: PKD domain-containing protein, partial [Thermoplasmata archaeon]
MTIKNTAVLLITGLMVLSVFPLLPANTGTGGSGTVATGTEYLAFWSGELRIIAQKDYTQVTLYDIRTGALLPINDPRLVTPLPSNPFTLASAGDMWTGLGGMQSYWLEIQVKIVSQCANGSAEPKPVTVWTGQANPAYDPGSGSVNRNDPWMSYIPAISSETRYTGSELGTEFIGFTSDEMYIFAQKKAGITTNIVVDDLPSNDGDSDDSYSLTPTSPELSYSDSELEVYYITGFDDDVVWVTGNVVCSVLVGKGSRDADNEDWSATPPSYAAGDDGIELGTLFYTYGRHSLAVFPLEDDTMVQITDLSDGDDNWAGLLDGYDSDGDYEFYTATPQSLQGAMITPRSSSPAVTIITNSNPLDQDYVKIESDKPVLVYVGPVSSDILEYADVAYSVPTGPDSREIYCYAQNHGDSMDLQIFAYDQNTNVTITSLSVSRGTKTHHDFTIGPYGTESWSGTAGYGWWWGSGVWHGELLHITSDKPITVINGDYDQAYFGAFLPFTQVAPTLPPIAVVGADLTVYVGDTVFFDGSASFDQDTFGNPPDIVSYEWDFDYDGITFDVDASGAVQTHTYYTPGNYTVRLFVTDNENETDDTFLIVTVLPPPNEPPVAEAGLNQTVSEGDTVQFDGTGSSDPDGNITSYEWDFDANMDSDGDGDPTNDVDATGPAPTHVYGDDGRGVDGNYTVTLTVTDDGNLTDTDTCIVTVLNVDPTATMESATMDVEIVIRVAGAKWSNIGLTLYEDGSSMGYLEVERWPGS